eukprot:366311-Chlamydomonas_euryale.AAC.12
METQHTTGTPSTRNDHPSLIHPTSANPTKSCTTRSPRCPNNNALRAGCAQTSTVVSSLAHCTSESEKKSLYTAAGAPPPPPLTPTHPSSSSSSSTYVRQPSYSYAPQLLILLLRTPALTAHHTAAVATLHACGCVCIRATKPTTFKDPHLHACNCTCNTCNPCTRATARATPATPARMQLHVQHLQHLHACNCTRATTPVAVHTHAGAAKVPLFMLASASASPAAPSNAPAWRVAVGNLAAGAVSGCAVEAALYPIDTIKTRLQVWARKCGMGGHAKRTCSVAACCFAAEDASGDDGGGGMWVGRSGALGGGGTGETLTVRNSDSEDTDSQRGA